MITRNLVLQINLVSLVIMTNKLNFDSKIGIFTLQALRVK